MPGNPTIAGENLGILATYARETYKDLEKKCRGNDDKETRKAMIKFMMDNGFANEKAPGHKSSKDGKDKGMQKGTSEFCKAVAKKL